MASFYFQITNIRQKPKVRPRNTKYGWIPPWQNNSLASESHCFLFNGTRAFEVATLPPSKQTYSTRSVCHDDSRFWAVPYDATQASVGFDGPDWQRIGFRNDYSDGLVSWVGLEGKDRRLGRQQYRDWIHMLFPENHQPLGHGRGAAFGGLGGELPILLALIVFSAEPRAFYAALGVCMDSRAGHWGAHSFSHGPRAGYDGRGVVVSVFTAANTSTAEELEAFENGRIFFDDRGE
ncbi:hypothetical protein IWX90DRAFT_499047 [Phyllosticta citrichinensis]|uniref:Uncharacterized protein n=1 Tax=Phyllosticta citrichinensis TaxID=1130410 RepID=A0ABR1XYN5_9PEZI